MKITDLRCARIGDHVVARIVTDDGLSGYGMAESFKPYLKPFVLHLREAILDMDPTDVERVMLRIRKRGGFKPYGTAVSMVENALWDIAGRAAGVPVYKLLGGKVRDRVRVYNGAIRGKMPGQRPEDYAAVVREMKALPYRFSFVKMGIGFHSPMRTDPAFHMGDIHPSNPLSGYYESGVVTMRGMDHLMDCVAAMKAELGDDVGLALDCGPGFTPTDALRFARACEPHRLMWLEDMITGDYTPYVNADVYRDVTHATTTPIHTGEQIYLRQNFKHLIETHAVNVVGPDPCDVGGLAELKWIAEYADLHGILMAPHGTGNGLLGLAALVQVCATMPQNFIAFEVPWGKPDWWFDIVEGLPDPLIVDGHIAVWDRPGLGIDIVPDKAAAYMEDADAGFFD